MEFPAFRDKHFRKGSKQESVFNVIREMPIDSAAADRLFSYGFTSVSGLTVGDVLDRAESDVDTNPEISKDIDEI